MVRLELGVGRRCVRLVVFILSFRVSWGAGFEDLDGFLLVAWLGIVFYVVLAWAYLSSVACAT